MLYFYRIDVSEGTDVSETNSSNLSHWYFLNYSFKFQLNVYNRCHDLSTMF